MYFQSFRMLSFSSPFVLHFGIVFPLTYIHKLNVLEFLGLNFSLGITLYVLTLAGFLVYDTWIGVYFGLNVDLKKMGAWAVVTGATDGIGLAYCRELAKRGINVVLMSRTLEKLQNCALELERDFGIQTRVIQMDFTGNIEIYEGLANQLSDIDIGTLINNVGMTFSRPTQFHDIPNPTKFIHDMININALAVTMMTHAVLPQMLRKQRGVIVNVGSIASCHNAPYYSIYGASKSYMDRFTQALSTEYKDSGVIFQYQFPGYVCTKLSKISKPNFGCPTAEQFAKAGIQSIGLQERSAIWLAHRAAHNGKQLLELMIPYTFSNFYHTGFRSFFLFAKKKELERLNIVYSHRVV